MFADSMSVFNAALNLPDDDRASLAFQLLQSLKPAGVLSEDDPQLEPELQRRSEAFESGQSQAADWDDVAARLRKALEK
jgi:putative addiction module component (TIGR02574 family)